MTDSPTPSIAAVVLSKNEAQNIERCVRSLHWADEILVVDDDSTDETVRLAESCGARVVRHRFESFAKQRNWSLDHGGLQSEWVLMLDADEVSTDEFRDELTRCVRDAAEDVVAFRNCRKTMFDGVWLKYSDGFPVWIMRMVRRGRAYFQDSGHGEVPVPPVDGSILTMREPFLHFAFSRGMDDWWARHVRYAGKEAAQERQSNSNASIASLFSLDRSRRRSALRTFARSLPARGFLRFIYQYLIRGGFLDGKAGLRFCRMMGCYETMISIRSTEPVLDDR